MSDWPETTFGELISAGVLEIGDGYRAKNEELGGDGPIFLRAGLVQDSGIDVTSAERFRAPLSPQIARKMSRPGDTLVTTKGNSTGRVAFVTEHLPPLVYSPHLSYWRPLQPAIVLPGFLRYWSRSEAFRQQVTAMAASTDMAPYLSLTDQRRLRIRIPPVQVQSTAATILASLDDKIELNRRTGATLLETARALYRSQFVGGAARGADSRRGTLLDVASLLSGGTPRTERAEYWHGVIPWATAKDVSQSHGLFLIQTVRRISELGVAASPTKMIPQFATVVVARGATTGRMIMLGRAMAMNQTCYALVSRDNAPFWLYCHLEHVMHNLVHSAHGSVFNTITTSTFASARHPLPDPLDRILFDSTVEPLFC